MNHTSKLALITAFFISQALSPVALAGVDTSVASLNLSGNVPVIFDVTARGYPGDLDLNGKGVVAKDRLIGTFHFKYNAFIDTLTLQSTEADGVPSSGGTGYNFGTGFMLKFGACSTVHADYKVAWDPKPAGKNLGAGVDIVSAASHGTITAGVEEDCDLYATWGGTAVNFPLAGKYTLTMTLTMVSL